MPEAVDENLLAGRRDVAARRVCRDRYLYARNSFLIAAGHEVYDQHRASQRPR